MLQKYAIELTQFNYLIYYILLFLYLLLIINTSKIVQQIILFYSKTFSSLQYKRLSKHL